MSSECVCLLSLASSLYRWSECACPLPDAPSHFRYPIPSCRSLAVWYCGALPPMRNIPSRSAVPLPYWYIMRCTCFFKPGIYFFFRRDAFYSLFFLQSGCFFGLFCSRGLDFREISCCTVKTLSSSSSLRLHHPPGRQMALPQMLRTSRRSKVQSQRRWVQLWTRYMVPATFYWGRCILYTSWYVLFREAHRMIPVMLYCGRYMVHGTRFVSLPWGHGILCCWRSAAKPPVTVGGSQLYRLNSATMLDSDQEIAWHDWNFV